VRYAIVGYILTYATLVGYVALLFARLRRAEEEVGSER
jgi:hypothetical protein